MKKLVLVFLLCILLINLVLAVEIKLTKESYAPGETLQAEIYGNFISGLSLENIYFYRERNIPVLYDILKTKDKYLLYAILPAKEGNYTLKIKNTKYTTETGSSTETIAKEFKIEKTNETTLTVNPGFVVAREDFSISVRANRNKDIIAEFEATGEKQNISLIQNQEKKIHFSVSGISDYRESNIKLDNYNIPVFIFPEKSQQEIIQESGAFRFSPLEIKATILKKQDFSFKVSLLNLGEINITNIKFSSELEDKDLGIKISPETITELESGGEEFINLVISSEKPKAYTGKIVALTEDNLTAELALEIEVTENESEVAYESPGYTQYSSCSEIGKICETGESCDVESVFTEEGYCCKGTCKKESKSSGSWLWGVVIIIIVFIAIGLLYFFMKKRQKKPVDFLKKREEKFEERMHPEGTEVRKSLTRI